jgi:hypothetical protein
MPWGLSGFRDPLYNDTGALIYCKAVQACVKSPAPPYQRGHLEATVDFPRVRRGTHPRIPHSLPSSASPAKDGPAAHTAWGPLVARPVGGVLGPGPVVYLRILIGVTSPTATTPGLHGHLLTESQEKPCPPPTDPFILHPPVYLVLSGQ